ncbi:Hypothetical protein A7982_05909 [Minicystis rosea]|nr:Hypothetical protein A7982_05909 [Minicystis rosea]
MPPAGIACLPVMAKVVPLVSTAAVPRSKSVGVPPMSTWSPGPALLPLLLDALLDELPEPDDELPVLEDALALDVELLDTLLLLVAPPPPSPPSPVPEPPPQAASDAVRINEASGNTIIRMVAGPFMETEEELRRLHEACLLGAPEWPRPVTKS